MGAERTEITSLGFGCWEEVCGTKKRTRKTANSVQHPGGIYGSGAYRNHLPDFGCWEEVCGTKKRTIKTANSVQHPGGIYGSKAYRNHLPGFWVLGGDLRN